MGRNYGLLFFGVEFGGPKREIAFFQLQIPVMDQPSHSNQRLKLTQEEGLLLGYDTDGTDGVGL